MVGRYTIHERIASGGMATVHLGKLHGVAGFSPIVAIKCVHSSLATDPEFINMLLDEARLAARVRHPNVVPVLDLVRCDDELFMVMEYVHGEAVARLMRATCERGEAVPPAIASAILSGVLHGLHAAHEARSETSEPLEIVHRDISPQNVIVGADGVARILDFGVAKAAGRVQTTREGQVKGKLAYMAPEQLRGHAVSRQADVYSAAVVLWEVLSGRRLFDGDNEGRVVEQVLFAEIESPSTFAPGLSPALDAVVARGLARDCNERFRSAREMATAIQNASELATPHEVGEWVERMADEALWERQRMILDIEKCQRDSHVAAMPRIEVTSLFGPELVASQISRISIGPSNAAPRRKTRALQISAVALAAAAIVAVGVVRSNASSVGAERVRTEPLATTPTTTDAPAEPSSLTQRVPAPSASPAPTALPIQSKTTRRTRATTPSVECNPPFVRDDEGRKIYKRECLK